MRSSCGIKNMVSEIRMMRKAVGIAERSSPDLHQMGCLTCAHCQVKPMVMKPADS